MDSNIQQILTAAQAVQATIDNLKSQIASEQAEEAAEQSSAVYENLEYLPWLLAPGSLADSDTVGGNIPDSFQRRPSVECASFGIDPKGKEYANAYFFQEKKPDAGKTRFKYEISFLFPTQNDANASQALELDIQQVIKTQVFNIGFQFDFAEKFFRIWNRMAKVKGLPNPWVPTVTLAPRWKALDWHRVIVEGHRDNANVYYDALTFDGSRTQLTGSFPLVIIPNYTTDAINCAVQLDGNQAGTAYRVMIDSVRFTVS